MRLSRPGTNKCLWRVVEEAVPRSLILLAKNCALSVALSLWESERSDELTASQHEQT